MYKIILLMCLSISICQANTYSITCESNDLYTDIGPTALKFESSITVLGENNYILEEGNFDFTMRYDDESDYYWTNQSVETKAVENKKNYRPRVYSGHAKFEKFTSGFFGIVDFIVPHQSLLGENLTDTTFDGKFIMSWVEDHWGGTLFVECTLK